MYNPAQTGTVWTSDGEIQKDSSGKLVRMGGFNNLVRRLLFILQTEPGTYKYDPRVGIGLQKYRGRPNNKSTHTQIRTEIMQQLVAQNIVYPYTPSVVVLPTGLTSISIRISLSDRSFSYTTSIAFDMSTGRLSTAFPQTDTSPEINVPKTKPLSQTVDTEQMNKYLAKRKRQD